METVHKAGPFNKNKASRGEYGRKFQYVMVCPSMRGNSKFSVTWAGVTCKHCLRARKLLNEKSMANKKTIKLTKRVIVLTEIIMDARNEYKAFTTEDSKREYMESIEDLEQLVGYKLTTFRKDFYGQDQV